MTEEELLSPERPSLKKVGSHIAKGERIFSSFSGTWSVCNRSVQTIPLHPFIAEELGLP